MTIIRNAIGAASAMLAVAWLTAAAPPVRAEVVGGVSKSAVCDPANLANCAKPTSGGALSVTVTSTALPTGAATAANQTAIAAAPGSDASSATAVQGVTGGKAVKVDGSAVTQPVSASALPLPSGAATSALQTTGNGYLSTVAGTVSAGNVNVICTSGCGSSNVTATQGGTWTVQPGNTANTTPWLTTDSADAAIAAGAAPAKAGVTGCVYNSALPSPTTGQSVASQCDSNGREIVVGAGAAGTAAGGVISIQGVASMTAVKVDGSAVTQPVSAASLPLPTGAATASNQTATTAAAGSDATTVTAVQGVTGGKAVKVDGSAVTQPISGTVTANAGTGNFAVNHAQVNGVTVLAGAGAVGTGAQRVAVGQDTSTIAGSAPGTAGIASTNVVTVQGIASMTAVKTDGSAVTQPVSASALPLPTGAATSALQTTGNTSLSTIAGTVSAGNVSVICTSGCGGGGVFGPTAVGSLAANPPVLEGGTANAGATGTVQVIKVDSAGNQQQNITQVGGSAVALGSTTSSASVPVVIASDQAAVSVKQATAANLNATVVGVGAAGTPSGGILTVQGAASMSALKVDGSAVTQPVSAASLPLPTGAALDASVGTTNTDLGAPGATVCATDTGSCSLNALAQRLAQRLSTLNTTLGSPMQATGGTMAATESGTWTVQPGNTANSTPWLTTDSSDAAIGAGTAPSKASVAGCVYNSALPAPTTGQSVANQCDSSARQIVVGAGTAGTAAGGVVSIQGVASMTAVKVDGSAVTQPSSVADGSDIALGSKADAATCATTNTALACLRQIDADVKATGAVTIADGSNATQGSKADAKSTATDTTAVTLMQVLKEISYMEQNPAQQQVNPLSCSLASTIALASNLVVKGSAGVFCGAEVSADATLSAATWYIMVFNATSAPADGAVTPALCYQVNSGSPQGGFTFSPGGLFLSTGVTVVVSTTGCFTKTASAHAFIAGFSQ